jgi:hypothetical protein
LIEPVQDQPGGLAFGCAEDRHAQSGERTPNRLPRPFRAQLSGVAHEFVHRGIG